MQSTMKPMAIHGSIRSQKLAGWVKKMRRINKQVRARLSYQKSSIKDRFISEMRHTTWDGEGTVRSTHALHGSKVTP